MWASWVVFVAGLLAGYIYRALPVLAFYSFATLLVLMLWNGFVSRVWLLPTATVTDGVVFVLLTRLVGMIWRGDKNPLTRKMRVRNFYE